MQTFLPPGYSFSPDKLIDKNLHRIILNPIRSFMTYLEPTYANKNEFYVNALFIFAGILIFIAVCIILGYLIYFLIKIHESEVYHSNPDKFKELINHERQIIIVTTTVLGLLVMGLIINRNFSQAKSHFSNEYNKATFVYSKKSNLHVRMLGNKLRPTSITDRKKYPYKLYNIENTYLGKVQNKKFVPADNNAAIAFYRYYDYINKHNLSKKFAKHMIFKRDPNYLIKKDQERWIQSQWILTNNQDVTLHINQHFNVVED